MTVGLSDCANKLGVSYQRLQALVAERRVPRNEDGSFDVEAVRAAFERSKDPAQQSKLGSCTPEPGNGEFKLFDATGRPIEVSVRRDPESAATEQHGYADVRTQHETVKLNLKRLDLDERERRLISVDGVERNAREVAREVRDGLLAIPDRVASLIAAESDAGKVHGILSGEIRNALIALSDEIVSIQ